MNGPGLHSSYLGRMIKSATLANQATEQIMLYLAISTVSL